MNELGSRLKVYIVFDFFIVLFVVYIWLLISLFFVIYKEYMILFFYCYIEKIIFLLILKVFYFNISYYI